MPAMSATTVKKRFIEHRGPPPYRCFFCDKMMWSGYHIHHVDHDRYNNDPSNWEPAHHGCHISHHRQAAKEAQWGARRKWRAEVSRLWLAGFTIPQIVERFPDEAKNVVTLSHAISRWRRIDPAAFPYRKPQYVAAMKGETMS